MVVIVVGIWLHNNFGPSKTHIVIKCIVKITKYYRTHMCVWSNHICKFVLHKAWMVKWCKRKFENMLD
jgi:hypothetical protein